MKETFSFKAEQFFAKNWKYLFWGGIIGAILIAWELNTISSRMANLETVVRDNNNKVVLTTLDGRAVRVTKEPIKPQYLEKYIENVLVNGFIVDRASLTNNFEEVEFKKPSDILNRSYKLGEIWKNYLKDDKVKGEFLAYLNWLINAMVTNKLPERISVQVPKIEKFIYEENNFEMELSIKVSLSSYILSLGKYEDGNAVITINASGKFDLTSATDVNPYGMSLTGFTISMPTKAQ